MSAFDVCKRNTEPVAETILRSVNTHFKVLFGTDKLLKIINAPLFREWGGVRDADLLKVRSEWTVSCQKSANICLCISTKSVGNIELWAVTCPLYRQNVHWMSQFCQFFIWMKFSSRSTETLLFHLSSVYSLDERLIFPWKSMNRYLDKTNKYDQTFHSFWFECIICLCPRTCTWLSRLHHIKYWPDGVNGRV